MRMFLLLFVSGFFFLGAVMPAALAHEGEEGPDETLDKFLPAKVGTWNEGDYVMTLDTLADGSHQLTITKSGAEVFKVASPWIAFYERSTPIQDVTGDNIPDVVISTFSKESEDCCHATTVVSLGDTFKSYGTYHAGEYPITFGERTYYHNTQPEGMNRRVHAMMVSDGYGGHWTVEPVLMPVILAPVGGKYVIAPVLMRQPRWQPQQIATMVEDHKKLAPENFVYRFVAEPKKAESAEFEDSYSRFMHALLGKTLMLIYRGNQDQALELVAKSWPGTEEERERFWKDLWQVIDSKPHGRDIRELNLTY